MITGVKEAQENIATSEFFDRMTELDLIARDSQSAEDYKKRYLASITSFTAEQVTILRSLINDITVNYIQDTKVLKYIPWKFAKVGASIEKGWPHTHNDIIVLSDAFFTGGGGHTLLKTLIHEQIHVYQRLYPKDTSHFMEYVLDFSRVQRPSSALQELIKRSRNNPDIKGVYALHGRYVPLQMYRTHTPNDISESDVVIFDVQNDTVADADGIKYFEKHVPDIITQKEHPNEIMAVLIPMVLTSQEREQYHPILQKVRAWASTML
jgi:hypothetical protein